MNSGKDSKQELGMYVTINAFEYPELFKTLKSIENKQARSRYFKNLAEKTLSNGINQPNDSDVQKKVLETKKRIANKEPVNFKKDDVIPPLTMDLAAAGLEM